MTSHWKIKSFINSKIILFIAIWLSFFQVGGWTPKKNIGPPRNTMEMRRKKLRGHHKHWIIFENQWLCLCFDPHTDILCRLVWLQETKVIIYDPKPLGICSVTMFPVYCNLFDINKRMCVVETKKQKNKVQCVRKWDCGCRNKKHKRNEYEQNPV